MAEHVGAQAGEQTLKEHDHDQTHDQDIQGGQAFVDQHLVHHHLEKQGADEREQLQEQRNRKHLAQQLAVLDQAGDEPGEIELGQITRQAGAAGGQQQQAGTVGRPLPEEGVDGFDGGAATAFHRRILEQHPLAIALGQQHPTFATTGIHQLGQRRQWGQCQAFGQCAAELGFQAQLHGRAQQFVVADGGTGAQAPFMHQRVGIGCDVVQAGQQAQSPPWLMSMA